MAKLHLSTENSQHALNWIGTTKNVGEAELVLERTRLNTARRLFCGLASALVLSACQSTPATDSPDVQEASVADRVDTSNVSWVDGKAPDLRGGSAPTVLNFWATNCAPCVEEMPILQEFFQDSDGAVMVVGIAVEPSISAVEGFLEEHGVSFPVAVDTDHAIGGQFPELPGIPVTMLLDGDGQVIDTRIGTISRADLDSFLETAT